jgi:hypothetical protein
VEFSTLRKEELLILPTANCFTLTRTGIERTIAAVFGTKKEIPG